MTNSVLICFAVKEEAAAFKRLNASTRVRVLITGMGARNAERSIREELQRSKPDLVLSCGFAGGLNPDLKCGDIVFQTRGSRGDGAQINSETSHVVSYISELESTLAVAGAKPVRFHFATKVVPSAAEKRQLWQATQADAVEMESQVIGAACREKNILFATVRVVLDTAAEDLPLDFNALMTADQRIDFVKLAIALARSPGKIPALIRFQKQCAFAAEKLADVLAAILK